MPDLGQRRPLSTMPAPSPAGQAPDGRGDGEPRRLVDDARLVSDGTTPAGRGPAVPTRAARSPIRERRRGLAPLRRPLADAPQRTAHPAGYVLVAGGTCFLLWLLMFAPTLQHNAQAGPLGIRRTAALDVLGPVAALSRTLHLNGLTHVTNEALGRQGQGSGGSTEPVPPPPTPSSHPHGGGHAVQSPNPSVPVLPKPTKSHPLSVLVVGDSLAIGLGTSIASTLARTGVFRMYMDARISTGLSRPDYFNWPVQIRFDIARYNPDIVVIMLGGNDPQPLLYQGHGVAVNTAQWLRLYSERVDLMARESAAGGRQVVWVGLPITNKPNFNWAYRRQNTVYRQVQTQHPGFARYFDIWRLFQSANGHYAPYLEDPSGDLVLMRAADGVHMTPPGYQRLAAFVFDQMRPMWRKTASPSPTPTVGSTPPAAPTGATTTAPR